MTFLDESTPQKQKEMFYLNVIHVREVNSSYRPYQNERTRMKRKTVGQISFYSATSLLLSQKFNVPVWFKRWYINAQRVTD